MLLSMSDMFSWMGRNMAREAGATSCCARPFRRWRRCRPRAMSISLMLISMTAFTNATRPAPRKPLSCLTGSPVSPHLRCWISVRAPGRWPGYWPIAGAGARDSTAAQALLAVARRKVPEGHFLQADIRSFTLDERFDAVVCMNGALHSSRRATRHRAGAAPGQGPPPAGGALDCRTTRSACDYRTWPAEWKWQLHGRRGCHGTVRRTAICSPCLVSTHRRGDMSWMSGISSTPTRSASRTGRGWSDSTDVRLQADYLARRGLPADLG